MMLMWTAEKKKISCDDELGLGREKVCPLWELNRNHFALSPLQTDAGP